jgi:DNA-binding transcriptional regulator of glucitol operon
MGPLLAAASGFNISYMMQDSGLAQRAASLKGRFFQETLREVLTKPNLVETEDIVGEGTMVETRVVVLAEIAITLASSFFASSILLSVIFWRSRLAHRPLNLTSDPSSTIGLSLMINQRLSRSSTLQSMHGASQVDLYTALQREKYLTSNDSLIKAGDDTSKSDPQRNSHTLADAT